jgi:two-component system nitrate/nitrite response regulator NarL
MAIIRTLLADDHPVFRHGLAALLQDQPDFQVVGMAATADQAVKLAQELQPDLVIIDIILPGDGLAAAESIVRQVPQAKVVMLTVSEEDEDILRAVETGVHGYLLKEIEPDQLVEQLRAVYRGQAALSNVVAAKLLRTLRQSVIRTGPGQLSLTPRETEILELLSHGLSNKEIADKLSITESTVKTHLHSLLTKTGARNRAELAAWAIRSGLDRSFRARGL